MRVLPVIGESGAGKTTICELACETDREFSRVSPGDISRALPPVEMDKRGLDPREGRIRAGIMHAVNDRGGTVLLDGFPRDIGQMLWLNNQWGVSVLVHIVNLMAQENRGNRARMGDRVKEELIARRQQDQLINMLRQTEAYGFTTYRLNYNNGSPANEVARLRVLLDSIRRKR